MPNSKVGFYKGSIANVFFVNGHVEFQSQVDVLTLYAIHQEFPAICFKIQANCPMGYIKEFCENTWFRLNNITFSESKLLYRTSKMMSTLREVNDSEMASSFANRATFIFTSKEKPTNLTDHSGWVWSCNDCDKGNAVRANLLNHLKDSGHGILWPSNLPPFVWGKEKTKLKDQGVLWGEPKMYDKQNPLCVFGRSTSNKYLLNSEVPEAIGNNKFCKKVVFDNKDGKKSMIEESRSSSCHQSSPRSLPQFDSDMQCLMMEDNSRGNGLNIQEKSSEALIASELTPSQNTSKMKEIPSPRSLPQFGSDRNIVVMEYSSRGNGLNIQDKSSEALIASELIRSQNTSKMKEIPLRKSGRNVDKTKVTYYSDKSDREDLTSDSGDDPVYEENISSMSEEEMSDSSLSEEESSSIHSKSAKSKSSVNNSKQASFKKPKTKLDNLQTSPESDFEDGVNLESENLRKQAQKSRRQRMAQSLDFDHEVGRFIPDADDLHWEKVLLLKDAQIKSKRYMGKKNRIPLKARKIMEQGGIVSGTDRIYQSSTVKERKNSMRRLMGVIQKERNLLFPGLLPNGKIKYKYWIDFREAHYIAPMNVMHLIDEFKSASVKCKMYGSYRKFLSQISKYAESQECLSYLSKPRNEEEHSWTPARRIEEAQRKQFRIIDNIARILNSMAADQPYAAWEAEKGENSAIRKEGKEEFEDVYIPDPNHIVPTYLESDYAVELEKELIVAASNPKARISYEKLKEFQDHVALRLALKAGNRTEFYATLRLSHLVSALERGLVDIPWIDEVNPQLNVNNCKKYLQGYCLIGNFHKTLNKQNVWLWTTQPDMVLLRCIEELVTRYLTSIGIETTPDTPLFISKNGGSMINSNNNFLSFEKICEITGCVNLTMYVLRKMFVNWQWSQCNAVLKECARYGTAHSPFVANKFYVSDKTKQLMSGMSHTAFWSAVGVLSDKEVLELTSSNAQTERFDAMVKELRDRKLEEYLQLKSNTDIYDKPIESRLITEKAKGAFIEMIVLAKMNGVSVTNSGDIADILLSKDAGKTSVKCCSVILRMLDVVPRDWTCLESLTENLVLSTPFIFSKMKLHETDIALAIRKIELNWAQRLGSVLTKMKLNKAVQNSQAISMLKKLYVHVGSPCYTLGNQALLRQVKHWDMSKQEKEAMKESADIKAGHKKEAEKTVRDDISVSGVSETPSESVPGEVAFEVEDSLVDLPKSPFKIRVRIGDNVQDIGDSVSVTTVHKVVKNVSFDKEGVIKFNDPMKRSLLKTFVLLARNPLVIRKCHFTEQCQTIWESESIDINGDLIPLRQVATKAESLGDIFHRRGKLGDTNGLKVPIQEVIILKRNIMST